MRFGVCGSLDRSDEILGAGFDYVEVGATSFALADPFDPEPYRRARAIRSNLFFPGSIKLFGPEATAYRDYALSAFERASVIGIEVMVVGSGGTRRAPEGQANATAAFADVVAELQALATPFGISLAPEALNRSETNVGTSLPELALLLQARGVGYTSDSYHSLHENRTDGGDEVPTAEYWQAEIPILPLHVHVSNLARKVPAADDAMILGFAARLRELGYDGTVSLEAGWPDPVVESWTDVLHNLKSLFLP